MDKHCYLGYGFENKIRELKDRSQISCEEERDIRERCINFIKCLIKHIKNRLPENVKTLKKISLISVGETLKHNKFSLIELLVEFGRTEKEIEKIETQWQNINLLKWSNVHDTKEFWYEVVAYKDASGNNPFHELSEFALEMLIIPHSNADLNGFLVV